MTLRARLALVLTAILIALVVALTGSVLIAAIAGLVALAVGLFLAHRSGGSDAPRDPGRRRALALIGGIGAAGVLAASGAGAALRRALRSDPRPVLEAAARDLGSESLELVVRQYMPGRSGDLQLVLAPWNSSNYPQESRALVPDDPRTSHASVWMYLQRVPIVIHSPGRIAPLDSDERVTLADLAPTTAQLLGMPFDAVDGRVLPGITASERPPKVIVTYVIDGGGWNVLQHWDGEGDDTAWPELKRLMREGATYRNAIVGSFPAVTACAHATIGTGAFPRTHGITGHNVRYGGEPRKAWGEAGNADPSFLEVPTLADMWTEATDGRAWIGELGYQIWHLGMIGRGGTAPLGRPPVAVLWDEAGGGGWIPQHPTLYRLPDAVPTPGSFDELLARYSDPGIDDVYTLRGAKANCCTPPIIQHQGDLIEMAFDSEPIGEGEATSLLYVNVKAPDYAGHVYNYLSLRERFALEEVDRQIGRLRRLLDERFEPGEAVLIVTADHGQAPTVNLAGGVRLDPIQLEEHLVSEFGPSLLGIVESVAPSEIYLDRRALQEVGVSLDEVAASLTDYRYGQNLGPYVPESAIDRDRLERRIFSAVVPSTQLDRLQTTEVASYGPGMYDGDPEGIPPITW